MALLVTLQELQDAVRSRADQPVGGIITDAELVSFINAGARRLYGRLVASDQDTYLKNATLALAPDNVALPADLFKLVKVEAFIDSQSWVPLRRVNVQESIGTVNAADRWALEQRYSLRGPNLYVEPNPPPWPALRIWYVPDTWAATALGAPINKMTATDDTVSAGNGWDELIIIEAAIRCCQKEESPRPDFEAERERLFAQIAAEASDRDSAAPRTAIDVRPGGWR